MTDPLPRMSPFKRFFVLLALGAVVGILGANSFADAAGLDAKHSDSDVVLRVFCGFVLGIGTIAVVIVAGHFGSLGVAALSQSSRRPGQAMAITLVVCGGVCLLMALGFEWYVVASSQVIRPTTGGGPQGSASINFPSMPGMPDQKGATISVSGSGQVQIGKSVSPVAHVVALCSFAAGAVLIALGIWSSMSPKPEGAWDARAAASGPAPAPVLPG